MEKENILLVEKENGKGKGGKYQREGKIAAPFSGLLCTIRPYFLSLLPKSEGGVTL